MAVHYGLSLYVEDPQTVKDLDKYYKEEVYPDEKLKTFYHQTLPWFLMISHVGRVHEITIPVIINRLKETDRRWYEDVDKALKPELTVQKALEKLKGYSVNVITKTTSEFIKNRAMIMKHHLLPLMQADINRAEKRG